MPVIGSAAVGFGSLDMPRPNGMVRVGSGAAGTLSMKDELGAAFGEADGASFGEANGAAFGVGGGLSPAPGFLGVDLLLRDLLLRSPIPMRPAPAPLLT